MKPASRPNKSQANSDIIALSAFEDKRSIDSSECRSHTTPVLRQRLFLTVCLAVKNVPFDPMAVFNRGVTCATSRTCHDPRGGWPANFGNRAGAPVATCLQSEERRVGKECRDRGTRYRCNGEVHREMIANS